MCTSTCTDFHDGHTNKDKTDHRMLTLGVRQCHPKPLQVFASKKFYTFMLSVFLDLLRDHLSEVSCVLHVKQIMPPQNLLPCVCVAHDKRMQRLQSYSTKCYVGSRPIPGYSNQVCGWLNTVQYQGT